MSKPTHPPAESAFPLAWDLGDRLPAALPRELLLDELAELWYANTHLQTALRQYVHKQDYDLEAYDGVHDFHFEFFTCGLLNLWSRLTRGHPFTWDDNELVSALSREMMLRACEVIAHRLNRFVDEGKMTSARAAAV